LKSTLAGAFKTILLVPQGFFSWDYNLCQGDTHLSSVSVSSLGEEGEFNLFGENYHIHRESLAGPFLLLKGNEILGRTFRPNVFVKQFEIEYQGRDYVLKSQSALSRVFCLADGEATVAIIRRRGIFSSSGEALVSESLPLPLGIFAIWLIIVFWKKRMRVVSSNAYVYQTGRRCRSQKTAICRCGIHDR